MEHVILLEEILSILAGFIAASLLLFSGGARRRKDIPLLVAAIIAQNLRIMMYALSQYNKLSDLELFPKLVERSQPRWLVYYLFLCIASYLLLAWIFSLARWKRFGLVSLFYWIYYGFVLAAKGSFVFGLDLFQGGAMRFYRVVIGYASVSVDKLLIAGACAFFLAGRRDARDSGSSLGRIGVALLLVSQILDLILTFVPVHPLSALFGFASFYAFPFFVIAGLRLAIGGPPVREGASYDSGAFAACYGLAPEEMRIVDAILQGRNNKEMAYAEALSLSTMKHRIFLLYKRLGISSRFELIALAGKSRYLPKP